MANYDAKIRVGTQVDASGLDKVQEGLDSVKNSGENAAKAIGKVGQSVNKIREGTFHNLTADVEEYATALKYLEDKGFGAGDDIYDSKYIGWIDAKHALDEYNKSLYAQSETGKAEAQAKAAAEAEKEATKAAAQRAREEAKAAALAEKETARAAAIKAREEAQIAAEAEKNLQIENAKLQKQIEEEAEANRLAAIKASAVIADQQIVALLEEEVALKKRLKELESAGVTSGYQEHDEITGRLSDIKNEVGEYVSGFTKAEASGTKFFNTIAKGSKKASGLLGTIGSRLKGIALSLLVFNWISKAFNAMVSGMKEGFRNLAQYSSDYNTAMSSLKSSSEQLKNGLAAAFAPIVNIAIPYLSKLIGWLNTAAETVSKFLAAISGKSSYTRAKKQVIDYAKSLEGAQKSANGVLAAFDELNVLNTNKADGASNAGGAKTGADAFEEVQLTPADYSWADELIPKLEKIRNIALIIAGAFALWKIAGFLGSMSTLLPMMQGLGKGVAIVGAAIAGWHVGQKLYELLTGEKIDMSFFEQMDAILQSFQDGTWADALKLWGEDIWGGISAANDTCKEFIDSIYKKILEIAMKVVVFVAKIVIKIKNKVTSIKNTITNAFNTIIAKLSTIMTKALTIVKRPLNSMIGYINKMIAAVESLINSIIKALNKLSFTAPDWLPEPYGGKSFGFDLKEVSFKSVPYLADGAVIPPNKKFLAVLGDQTSGTNIEAPLSTIEDAVQNVLNRNGSSTGVTIRFEGSMAQFVRQLKPYIAQENIRTGGSFIVGEGI